MKRIKGKRKIAAALLDIVESGKHYDQGHWLSLAYFGHKDEVTAGELRGVFEKNVCGTTACVAGNTVILTLHKNAKYDWLYNNVIDVDGSKQDVSAYAQDALGLNNAEANWLFNGDRDVLEVTEALKLLAAGESIIGLVTAWDED